MNDGISEIGASTSIRDSIRAIALRGVVNRAGSVVGTERITGYVAKVHKDGEFAGTIDVQEYVATGIDDGGIKVGYHEGVLLSSIQDNSNGMVIIPKMYSEVVITRDSDSGLEYVSMMSHVDVIQLDSHDTVSVGVKEREPYNENDADSPMVHELPETGVASNTTYKKDSIVSQVVTKNRKEASKAVIGTSGVYFEHNGTKVSVGDDSVIIEKGSSKIVVKDGAVYLGGDGSAEPAVLGDKLIQFLHSLINTLSATVLAGSATLAFAPNASELISKLDSLKSVSVHVAAK